LGDFSFKTIGCKVSSLFVYLFVYPFIDGNLTLWHARAPARPHSVPCMCFRSRGGEPLHSSDSFLALS